MPLNTSFMTQPASRDVGVGCERATLCVSSRLFKLPLGANSEMGADMWNITLVILWSSAA